MPTESKPKPPADYEAKRLDRMVRAAKHGVTLQDLEERFQLETKRIRRLLAQQGVKLERSSRGW